MSDSSPCPRPVPLSASESPSASETESGPVALSADGLHKLALEAFRTGNRGRLSLCEALRVLGETRLVRGRTLLRFGHCIRG